MRAVFALLLAAGLTALSAPSPERAASFALPAWPGSRETIRLEDFAGQILVLDFFAYWCAPCQRASRDLEAGVQQYYAAQQGNPAGVPVRVLSINIEKNAPERTAEFIRRTQASLVANDFGGTLLKQYGQVGIPFLVIIDARQNQSPTNAFRVVYTSQGFQGLTEVRGVIDAIGASRPNVVTAEHVPPVTGSGAPVVHKPEFDTEFVWAADIRLTDSRIKYGQQRGDTEWELAFSYATFNVDYQPNTVVDAFGFRDDLDEERLGGQLGLRHRISPAVTFLASAGIYVGYPDFRRVWIANRYRQKYDHPDFPRVPPYHNPDPRGHNWSLGARWEYLPAAGFAELRLGYAREKTAPGYEDSIDGLGNYRLLQGRERLRTRSIAASTENILSSRVRLLNEMVFTDTTARDPRLGYQGSLNVALGENWVMRGYGGVSHEEPQFDAHFFGLTLEYAIRPSLLLSVTGRYYRDSGEIENSLLSVTSAAPPLQSWETGVGIRYTRGPSTFKLYVAPFWTDYEPQRGIGREFRFLYTDRNWMLAQAAWSVQF